MCDSCAPKQYVTLRDIEQGTVYLRICGPWPPPTRFTDEHGFVWESDSGTWRCVGHANTVGWTSTKGIYSE